MSSSSDDCNGNVNLLSSKLVYKWEICNFSSLYSMKLGECIQSEEFCSKDSNSNITWLLQLFPMAKEEENKDYLSLYLFSLGITKYDSTFEFSIIDDKGKVLHKTIQMIHQKGHTRRGFDKFVNRSVLNDKLENMLMDDKLRIVCEIVMSSDDVYLKNAVDDQSQSYGEEVSKNLEKFLNNDKFSDVELVVDGKTLSAHKIILTSRSPVFAAMFDHRMQEATSNIVNIEDIDFHVFQEMLRFIYSGRVNDIEKVAKDLLTAADKYDISSLKSMCEETMCKCVSVDNAIEFFAIADLCDVHTLKSEVKTFMIRNAKDIARRPDFRVLRDIEEDLMMEIVRSMILQDDVK